MFPVSREKYNAAIAERDEIKDLLEATRAQLDEVTTSLSTANARIDELTLEVESIKANPESIPALVEKYQDELAVHADATSQALAEKQQAEELLSLKTTEVQNLLATLNELHPAVAAAATTDEKFAALKNVLSKKPAAAAIGNISDKDPNASSDEVDWDTLMSLPHMQQTT